MGDTANPAVCPSRSLTAAVAESGRAATFWKEETDSDNDSVCSELDLDDCIARHAGSDLPIRTEPAPVAAPPSGPSLGLGVISTVFSWLGSFRVKSQREKLARRVAHNRAKRVFGHMDQKAADIRRKVELTEAKIEALYGDPSIESPSTHPRVKKLHKTLAKYKRVAAAINIKRYETRRLTAT